MRKASKIVAILAAVGLLIVGVSLFSIYEASQTVPEFYREAISRGADDQQVARDEFVAQVAALASDLHRAGRWQTLFTDEQINAWLALELGANYPELLPAGLRDPRISIQDNEATIACRYQSGEISAILSLSVDAYLKDASVLALRIRRARAGALPVPLAQVLDAISQAARRLNLRLEWRKTHGDPVALIFFPKPHDGKSDNVKLQTVELRSGELFVAGTIGSAAAPSTPSTPAPTTPTAQAPAPVPASETVEAAESQSVADTAAKDTLQK